MNCRACGHVAVPRTYATYDGRSVAQCCIVRALKNAGVTRESVLQRMDDERARLLGRLDQVQARLDGL